MATEAHKVQVGVFVMVAAAIGIGTVIWLGASRFFEKTEHFVTYVSESVQGLDPGAAVKYRGVPAGGVDSISIAPDGELIEVRMNIDVKAAKALKRDPNLRATLELSGITGLRYIEIDRRAGDALNQAPTLSFKPPYEVIASSRSSFKAIQNALGDVYDRVMQLDLGGISNDARAALQSATQLLQDERIPTILTNFQTATQSVERVAKNVEETTRGLKLAAAVENATQATEDAKLLLADLRKGVNGEQVAQTLDQLNRLVQSTQQFIVGLQATTDRFNRTVGNLQSLTEELRNQPSRLLFAEPPAPRHPAQRSNP